MGAEILGETRYVLVPTWTARAAPTELGSLFFFLPVFCDGELMEKLAQKRLERHGWLFALGGPDLIAGGTHEIQRQNIIAERLLATGPGRIKMRRFDL